MFYADLVEGIGSDDGREVACGLDELRQSGQLGRDRDGRYHLAPSKPGVTAHRRRPLSRSQYGPVRHDAPDVQEQRSMIALRAVLLLRLAVPDRLRLPRRRPTR